MNFFSSINIKRMRVVTRIRAVLIFLFDTQVSFVDLIDDQRSTHMRLACYFQAPQLHV